MPESISCLGSSAPSAATSTTLYTCPSDTETVISVITVCNRSATPTSIRVGIDVGGGGDGDADYMVYDLPIGANEALELGRGTAMNATDLLRVYNTLATVTFKVFGSEIDVS